MIYNQYQYNLEINYNNNQGDYNNDNIGVNYYDQNYNDCSFNYIKDNNRSCNNISVNSS